MATQQTIELLAEALSFLNDKPRFRLRRDVRRDSYELASRIEMHLASLNVRGRGAIDEARRRWALTNFIRVDPAETEFDETDDGYWIRGWIKIGKASSGDVDPQIRERYQRAVDALPLFTREVFNAHRLDGLDYEAVGDRFGVDRREVERLIAQALLEISRAFGPGA